MKIAVYTITKNEEQFIHRWAESCKEADYRLIVDTGSTDRTVEAATSAGCDVRSINISPWRFDDARNASLALIPNDIDLCIALDADEVLAPGWRAALEAIPSEITRPRYKYVWSWNPDGTEGLVYSGDKIHARENYRWVHPVHEVIACTAVETQAFCYGLEIHHYPDSSKSRSQYLPLLELAIKERPDDDRNRFYLGREYMFNNMNQLAEEQLVRHLELSTWDAERATSMRYLSRVTGKKEHWLLRACAEAPHRREPWVELARFYYDHNNWSSCLSACQRALAIINKPMEYLCEAESWGSLPHDMASVSAWNMGAKDISVHHSIGALMAEPANHRLFENCQLVHALSGKSKVDVVIPFKSNIDGLIKLLGSMSGNSSIDSVHLVADGPQAKKGASEVVSGLNLQVHTVELSSGIHEMWNIGLNSSKAGNHVLFVNDDVVLGKSAIDILASMLDRDQTLGLICPNYDNRPIRSLLEDVHTTSRSRYDGTGGMGGFCMMLRSEFAASWRFDTRMKWWYGDDDLVNWITRHNKKRACIGMLATCSENSSWTVDNDPPLNFVNDVTKDLEIFLSKWGG